MALNPDNIKGHEFKPGQSGNPAGRPPGIPNAKTRYKRLLELTETIKNPVTGKMEEFSIIEQLDMQVIAKARKGDLRAYRELMDRLEGRAAQSIELDATVNGVNLSAEQAEQLIRARAKRSNT